MSVLSLRIPQARHGTLTMREGTCEIPIAVELRFRAMASKGSVEAGLALLDKLDR